tara:strand:+ start:129 stop:569 length:441 start_codon:yes stop_codon:yes gene_type:complete
VIVKYSDLKEMVEKDMVIDETELDTESLKTPQLHNKYLIMLADDKLLLSKLKSDLKKLIRNKWLYYTGKMSQDELEENEWEPFQLTVLKTDIDKFIYSDDDIIIMENRISYQNEKTNYLENVVKIISSRQWMIKSAIEWIRFTQGS